MNLKNALQEDITCVQNWCLSNKMVLNTGKTKSCIITTKQWRSNLPSKQLNLNIGDDKLTTTGCDKLLGVNIDENFQKHISSVYTKISRSIALLCRIKTYFPLDARIKFYNAYILPHMEYCCTIWGNATDSSSLFKLKKRAAKIILDKPYV